MTDTKRMTNACNLVSQELKLIAFGDVALLQAMERLRSAIYATETRICHNKLIEQVPDIAGVKWSAVVEPTQNGGRGVCLHEISFTNADGEELYGHTLVENKTNIDFRFSPEYAAKLLDKPPSYFNEIGDDVAVGITVRLQEAFVYTQKIAAQRLLINGETSGSVAIGAPEGPAARIQSPASDGPEQCL